LIGVFTWRGVEAGEAREAVTGAEPLSRLPITLAARGGAAVVIGRGADFTLCAALTEAALSRVRALTARAHHPARGRLYPSRGRLHPSRGRLITPNRRLRDALVHRDWVTLGAVHDDAGHFARLLITVAALIRTAATRALIYDHTALSILTTGDRAVRGLGDSLKR
jgi:hypothetical protein